MFSEQYNGLLSMFNALHLITLLVLLIIFVIVYRFKDVLSKPKNDKIFRLSMGFTLLIFESGFHLWTLLGGGYNYNMIPLTGFCAMTSVLTIYALLFNKTKLFDYIIYFALTGSLFALIFVDTTYGFPHFRYFQYFVIHFGFLLASLYYFITNRVEITKEKYLFTTLILFIYTMIVLFADMLLNANWFYLLESPLKEISDFFGLPLYTILWIITIILLLGGWYLLLSSIKRRKK